MGIDPLVLDAGDLFFSTTKLDENNKESELYRAEAILEGYNRIGCDAINVGHYEMLNGLKFLKENFLILIKQKLIKNLKMKK